MSERWSDDRKQVNGWLESRGNGLLLGVVALFLVVLVVVSVMGIFA